MKVGRPAKQRGFGGVVVALERRDLLKYSRSRLELAFPHGEAVQLVRMACSLLCFVHVLSTSLLFLHLFKVRNNCLVTYGFPRLPETGFE
jgi:hypothetical protein